MLPIIIRDLCLSVSVIKKKGVSVKMKWKSVGRNGENIR